MISQLRVLYRVLAVLISASLIGIPLAIKRPGIYEKDAPLLVEQLNSINLVLYSDILFAVPHGLKVRWSGEDLKKNDRITIVNNVDVLKSILEEDGSGLLGESPKK